MSHVSGQNRDPKKRTKPSIPTATRARVPFTPKERTIERGRLSTHPASVGPAVERVCIGSPDWASPCHGRRHLRPRQRHTDPGQRFESTIGSALAPSHPPPPAGASPPGRRAPRRAARLRRVRGPVRRRRRRRPPPPRLALRNFAPRGRERRRRAGNGSCTNPRSYGSSELHPSYIRSYGATFGATFGATELHSELRSYFRSYGSTFRAFRATARPVRSYGSAAPNRPSRSSECSSECSSVAPNVSPNAAP